MSRVSVSYALYPHTQTHTTHIHTHTHTHTAKRSGILAPYDRCTKNTGNILRYVCVHVYVFACAYVCVYMHASIDVRILYMCKHDTRAPSCITKFQMYA